MLVSPFFEFNLRGFHTMSDSPIPPGSAPTRFDDRLHRLLCAAAHFHIRRDQVVYARHVHALSHFDGGAVLPADVHHRRCARKCIGFVRARRVIIMGFVACSASPDLLYRPVPAPAPDYEKNQEAFAAASCGARSWHLSPVTWLASLNPTCSCDPSSLGNEAPVGLTTLDGRFR